MYSLNIFNEFFVSGEKAGKNVWILLGFITTFMAKIGIIRKKKHKFGLF